MPEEYRIYKAAIEKWDHLHIQLLSLKYYTDIVKLNFYEELTKLFEMFKEIQIGFDAYLQKRKLNSPRLHFLSNNELLEMLSKGRDPKQVEPYFSKLFASISKPEFNNRGEIIAIFATNNERLELHRSKQKLFKINLNLNNLNRNAFDIELQAYLAECIKFLPSNEQQLLLLQNIFVDLIEAQNIIAHLIQKGSTSIEDISWTSQFRHYWSNDNFFVRLFNVSILYGYEYLALTKPFVKTDKVKNLHIQLALFQYQNFACLLQGPAATGKSETIKEFSKTLAQNSIEQLESLIIGTFLAGTILCLDEFNRLSSATMSTTINHILGIYQAKHSHNLFYNMHGLELSVNPLSAFFLSQNPNYVGRSALPSNTSSVAKIIDVPTADFEAIAEEYFLLASFNCSHQLQSVFSQCSAIVSPMRHYDFSLRTLLANVKNAIWLQNENSFLSEMGVTVKAAQNLLSSMFTVVDSKIFSKILLLSKSKPMITDSETAYKTALQQICETLNLATTPAFINACYN
uniref:Uncharacterized protein n=1 Tax=Panagrolaimus superbus TaxID=310955 RepID=A0A914XZC3_9BILA